MPRWLLVLVVLVAGCAPIRHSRENQVLDYARTSLGKALVDDQSFGGGRGRSLQVDGTAITPEMARAINESVLVEWLKVKPDTPPAIADVLALQFEKWDEGTGHNRTRVVWRRKNIPELDWVDRTFGGQILDHRSSRLRAARPTNPQFKPFVP